MSELPQTVRWVGEADGHLVLLDQTRLPAETVYLECRSVEDVWAAIRRLAVRGAPAIGVAAAYGVCVGVQSGRSVDDVCDYLATSRPTAVNLFAALERMRAASGGVATTVLPARLLAEARAIDSEDREMCAAMARHGADLLDSLPTGAGILTHCNAGALVSGSGDGTALAVIFELARRGKRPHVYADETRPLLQGARLTMWELQQRGIDATLICDSAAAQVMREGRVQAVITGADRIAANGDTANKIGTYGVATLARAHGIPFYVAAPVTTFDLSITSGVEIPIEQRAAEEVTEFQWRRPPAGASTDQVGSDQEALASGQCHLVKRIAPEGVDVYNPAFDVTPAALIAGIVTDRGIIAPVEERVVRARVG
jgi:methylthioribose-1-phosphate isomerase